MMKRILFLLTLSTLLLSVTRAWSAPVPGEGLQVRQHDGREYATYQIGTRKDTSGRECFTGQIWKYLPGPDCWEEKVKVDVGDIPAPMIEEPSASGPAHILVRTDKTYAYHTVTDTWIASEGPIDAPASFGLLNSIIVILYFLLLMGMGVYFSRRNDSSDRFFKGGGKIPWWAAGISIFATALSAITFLSIPAKAYATDWGMFLFNMGIILVVPVVIRFYLPLFRKLKVASVYEYLETRFSGSVRLVASAFFCLFMVARIAIILFLPSLALNAVTGIDISLCILLMGVVTII